MSPEQLIVLWTSDVTAATSKNVQAILAQYSNILVVNIIIIIIIIIITIMIIIIIIVIITLIINISFIAQDPNILKPVQGCLD